MTEKMDINTEVILIQNQLNRILGHQKNAEDKFLLVEQKFDKLFDLLHKEKDARMAANSDIKGELHGRINGIIFSILGGAALFIGGIITWVITKPS